MKRAYILSTWMQITFADGQWLTIYQRRILMEEGRRLFTPEKIDELVKKDKKGYLLEVDVEYPK